MIDKAMECWSSKECDTGTGGDVVMGYADGGGDTVNVWRAVSHMEAILQALTYPEIGTIVSTAADFNPDPAVHANDIRFLIQRGVDFIVGYPDMGVAIADAIKEADDAGIPYVSFSAGWVGLPDQEGALVPGEDYLTVVGEDLCALGQSFAQVLNDGVGTGEVAILGGTPGNALSLGWQRCAISSLASGVDLVNPPANENSTTGDTSWYPPAIPGVYQGLLTTNPEIKGWAYEYADGMYIGLQTYEDLGHPGEEPHRRVAHGRAESLLRLGGSERAHLQHLVLGRRQLPVAGRRHRGDDVAQGSHDPAGGRRAARDAAGDGRGLQSRPCRPGRFRHVAGAGFGPAVDVRPVMSQR